MIWFARQFVIVAAVGTLIVLFQSVGIEKLYQAKKQWFKSIFSRSVVYSTINLFAVFIVVTIILLTKPAATMDDYISSYLSSGILIIVITMGHVIYYQYELTKHLRNKQNNL